MGSIAALPFQNKANKQTNRGYNDAIGAANTAQKKAQAYLDPYNKAGQTALGPLTGLVTGQQFDPATGKTTTLSPDQRDDLMYQSPGYRFALDQTQQSLERSQAARGVSLSGGAQKEIAQYTSGLASQYSSDFINQLAQLANLGGNAAANQANTAVNSGNTLATLFAGKGIAQGAGTAAMGSLLGSGINEGIAAGTAAYGGGAAKAPTAGAGTGSGLSSINTQLTSPSQAQYASMLG